jgi:hypothetical protein
MSIDKKQIKAVIQRCGNAGVAARVAKEKKVEIWDILGHFGAFIE